MRQARTGDAAAYGALVRAHEPAALRVATVVLGGADGADDVVQHAMERAWRALRTFDDERPFRPWFLRIVANGARNHRRSRGRRTGLEVRAAARDGQVSVATPEDVVIGDDERRRVAAALGRLAADDRLVLALRHFEQLSEREMAEVLGCAPGTVKSRLSRATARLRAALLGDGTEVMRRG